MQKNYTQSPIITHSPHKAKMWWYYGIICPHYTCRDTKICLIKGTRVIADTIFLLSGIRCIHWQLYTSPTQELTHIKEQTQCLWTASISEISVCVCFLSLLINSDMSERAWGVTTEADRLPANIAVCDIFTNIQEKLETFTTWELVGRLTVGGVNGVECLTLCFNISLFLFGGGKGLFLLLSASSDWHNNGLKIVQRHAG